MAFCHDQFKESIHTFSKQIFLKNKCRERIDSQIIKWTYLAGI